MSLSTLQTVTKLIAEKPQVRLSYTVHDFSSYCGTYHPHNIRENKPTDQSSRWSSGTHDQAQFVLLRLDKPAVSCKPKKKRSSLYYYKSIY